MGLFSQRSRMAAPEQGDDGAYAGVATAAPSRSPHAIDVDEKERLEALRQLELLDTPREPEFDELAEMAAVICETPISCVTFVDEKRQWFKAVHGLDFRETSREVAICSHAIRQRDLLQVEDASLDPRFCDFNIVTDGTIRFYAGIPIHDAAGLPLGTLCVMDNVSRRLHRMQEDALRVLAQKANTRLALRGQRLKLERALSATKAANKQLAENERAVRLYQRQLEAANQRLLQMAMTDPLTGLLNRRAFYERLPVVFAESRRHGKPLSVLLLDVDDFKACNDRFGHDVGDQVLALFSHVLRQTVRASDMVVRYGGEEFLVLLPETGEEDAMKLGDRILRDMRSTAWPNGTVTASIGCASLSAKTPSGAAIVAEADEALYSAKRCGKDCVVHYHRQVQHQLHLAG
jgi:diguanylate cyclase (GGDEF)-like protein